MTGPRGLVQEDQPIGVRPGIRRNRIWRVTSIQLPAAPFEHVHLPLLLHGDDAQGAVNAPEVVLVAGD